MSKEHVRAALQEARQALDNFLADEAGLEAVDRAAALMAEAIEKNCRIYACGNGGSLCDAMHFAEEMTGRYRQNRPAYSATAIADASHLACVANDFGYEEVFSRYIEGCARPGDLLLGISTSGTSKNVLRAVRTAQKLGLKTVALTGRADAPIAEEAICRGVALEFCLRATCPEPCPAARGDVPTARFWAANVAQALIFAVMHLNIIQGAYALALGLLLGWIVRRTGRLRYAALLHMAVNASSELMDVLDPLLGGVLVPTLVVGALVSVALVRVVARLTVRTCDN